MFLALACLFIERRWTGYLTGAIALTGLAVLATRRDFDRTDLQFLLVVGLLPAAYLANMLIHGFGSSIFGRPARLLIGFFAFYAIRRAAPPPILFFDGCVSGGLFGTSPDLWAFAALLCMTAGFTTRTSNGGLHLPARTA